MTVRTVLWDADGVLQRVPGGWEESMRPALEGRVDDVDRFLVQAVAAERPALTGDVRWLDVLPDLLAQWGIADAYDDMVRIWLSIEEVPGPRAMVRDLRAAGVRCYLATNQDVRRARHMREHLGYDELLDGAFFSYDLRVAKPEPAYFSSILERLDLPAEEVLFVDDSAANVDAARSVGLAAEVWSYREELGSLRGHLARHGVPVEG